LDIRVWDAKTGKFVGRLVGHTEPVDALAFSLDGAMLASTSEDRTVRIWNVDTHDCIRVLECGSEISRSSCDSVAFSPSGKIVISGTTHCKVIVWNIDKSDCTAVTYGHTRHVFAVAISYNDKLYACGSYDGLVRLCSLETGICTNVLSGHHAAVVCVAFSPNGKLLASGSRDTNACLWDVQTGVCLRRLTGCLATVLFVAFSPSARVLAVARDRVQNTTTLCLVLGTRDRGCSYVFANSNGVTLTSLAAGRVLPCWSDDRLVRLWPLLDCTRLRVAGLLLRVDVAPYVVLDIVNYCLAGAHSFDVESAYMHVDKILFIVALQKKNNRGKK
jgi:WD40 repeat protein